MERLNSEGISRKDLMFVLSQRRRVSSARRLNSCLLCRNGPVNEAGLCNACYSLLDGEEFLLAHRYLTGEGPPGE